MRYVYAVAIALIAAHMAIRMHQCPRCGRHGRKHSQRSREFFPTSYGGFYHYEFDDYCGGCGYYFGRHGEDIDVLPPEMAQMFV